MSYKEVLAQHKADRDVRRASIDKREDNKIAELQERSKAKLSAISGFSETLQKKLIVDEQERITKAQEQGVLDAREKELDDLDQTGDDGIPEEEKEEDKTIEQQMKATKYAFDTAALNIQTKGGKFEDAYNVQSLAGWRVYAERKETARLAGQEYASWLEGEMAQNNELQLVDGDGNPFTPAGAETLDQKRIAMKALRQKFMKEQGLLGIKRSLLSDTFYAPAITAHRVLADKYEKIDAAEKGLKDYETAKRHYHGDKDFLKFISSLAPIQLEGKVLKRAGALDEAFKAIVSLADIGEFGANDYEELGEQDSGFRDKKGNIIKVKDKWKFRYQKLGEDLQEEWDKNAAKSAKAKETLAKEAEDKVFEEMEEMDPSKLTRKWVNDKANELGADPKYGGYSFSKLRDYAKTFAVDAVHFNSMEDEIKEKIANNSLTSKELAKYDPQLIDKYKNEAAIIDKQKGITGENMKALEEFVKEDAKNVFGNRNHPTIRNIIPKIQAEYLAVLAEARANPDKLPKGTDAPSYAFQVITTKYQDLTKFRSAKGYTENLGLLGNAELLKTTESIHAAETKKNEILKDKNLGEVLDPKVATQLISKESLDKNIKGMQHNPGYTYPAIVTDIVQRYQKQYRQETGKELDEIDVMNALNQAINPGAPILPKPNSIKTFTANTSASDRRIINSKQSSKESKSRILGGVAAKKGSENKEFVPEFIMGGFEGYTAGSGFDTEISFETPDLPSFVAQYELLNNNPELAAAFDITSDELTPDGEGVNWDKFGIAISMLGNHIKTRTGELGQEIVQTGENVGDAFNEFWSVDPETDPGKQISDAVTETFNEVFTVDKETDPGYLLGTQITKTISDVVDWTADQINVWLDSIVDDEMIRDHQLAKYKYSGNINDAPLRQ